MPEKKDLESQFFSKCSHTFYYKMSSTVNAMLNEESKKGGFFNGVELEVWGSVSDGYNPFSFEKNRIYLYLCDNHCAHGW